MRRRADFSTALVQFALDVRWNAVRHFRSRAGIEIEQVLLLFSGNGKIPVR